MLFNERKLHTLRYFSRREWTRPAQWSIDAGLYPIRSSYKYLKHLHRLRLLDRGDDITGHLVYRLSPRGAQWLLRNGGGV
jgi:hypothetical protein